jgi:hypothetical protein
MEFVLGFLAFCVLVHLWQKLTARPPNYHIRGRKRIGYVDAFFEAQSQLGSKLTKKEVERLLKKDKPIPLPNGTHWWFGCCPMPLSAAKEHTLVVGTTGSGKTITLRGFEKALLPLVMQNPDCRAIIYDASRDMGAQLASFGAHYRAIVLHPFDLRARQWAISEDIDTQGAAAAFAAIYVPAGQESQPYFRDAARDIVKNVVIAFQHRAPGKWFLRDVILATRSQEALKSVLDTQFTRHVITQYCNDKANIQAILSTLATLFAEHVVIAACWSKAQATFSLKKWVSGNQILLLPNDDSLRPSIDALNKVLIKRASELLLEHVVEKRLTFVFLDEIRETAKLDGMRSLLTRGRKYGVCVFLGYQSQKGMESLYTEPEADELAGLCANRVFLRLQDSSALWASKCLGEEDRIDPQRSESWSSSSQGSSSSSSVTYQRVTRPIVSEGEIRNLPLPTPAGGLEGFYDSSRIGVWHVVNPIKYWPTLPSVEDRRAFPDFVPRPASDQMLEPWGAADFARLCLAPPQPPPQPALRFRPISPLPQAVKVPLQHQSP